MEPVERYDVVIVGAGPAGSSAAIRLASAGLKVLLVEKAQFPREKLCGEFISPECMRHFAELGVMNEIAAVEGTRLERTIFFASGGRGISVESSWFGEPETRALGLSRAQMDLKLMERSRACGAVVREATSAAGLNVENGAVAGVELRDALGTTTKVSAAVIIDATGRTRALARRFDAGKTKEPAKYVAFKTHLRGVKLTEAACEIYAYRGGYGGCNRVEDDLYNLCFIVSAAETRRMGSDPERVMREAVCTNLRAADALRDAVAVKPWLAVPIDSFGRGRLVPAAGLITVGDAAAFIDPFTGSGMLMGFESARIASDALIDAFCGGFEFTKFSSQYKHNYRAAFDRRLYVCSLLRHAAFAPFLAEATIRVLGLNSRLRRRVARLTR